MTLLSRFDIFIPNNHYRVTFDRRVDKTNSIDYPYWIINTFTNMELTSTWRHVHVGDARKSYEAEILKLIELHSRHL